MLDKSNQVEQIVSTPLGLEQGLSDDHSTEQEIIERLSEEELAMVVGGAGEIILPHPNALMLSKIRQARQIVRVGGLAVGALTIAGAIGYDVATQH